MELKTPHVSQVTIVPHSIWSICWEEWSGDSWWGRGWTRTWRGCERWYGRSREQLTSAITCSCNLGFLTILCEVVYHSHLSHAWQLHIFNACKIVTAKEVLQFLNLQCMSASKDLHSSSMTTDTLPVILLSCSRKRKETREISGRSTSLLFL